MGQYDPERQEPWNRTVHRLRVITGLGTLALVIGLAGPVLLRDLPPYAMLPAAASAIGYLLLWLVRSPPPGWQPAAEDQRLETRYQRMRKFSTIHLTLFGGLSLLFILLILVGVFRAH